MNTRHFEMTDEERKLITEVMLNARKQRYTPERLCDLQKILDAQYFYYWMNDLKLEEQAKHLFLDPLKAHNTGYGDYETRVLKWVKNSKYCNSFLSTTHMGHNPLIWFMDDTHARGIFLFESHFTYLDDPDSPGAPVELFIVYANDFEKAEDGQWNISALRLITLKTCGKQREATFFAPKNFKIPGWKEL